MNGLVGRLLTLVDILQGRGKMTIGDLSTHLKVSERTVRRDLAKLQSLDLPVEVSPGRKGGVRLKSGSLFHALRFTDDEVLALSFGLKLVRQSPNVIPAVVIEHASRRLATVTTERLHQRLVALHDVMDPATAQNTDPNAQQSSSLILDLAEAIKQKKMTELSYRSSRDAITTRSIDPYGMVYLKPYWYVAGYCHLRKAIRTFRLDRIRRADIQNLAFVKPTNFDTLSVVSKAIAQAPTGGICCEIELHASMAEASRLIPPTAALLEPTNGSVLLQVRCKPEQLPRIALHLLSLPFSLGVIEPQGLRDALRELSKRAQMLADSAEP